MRRDGSPTIGLEYRTAIDEVSVLCNIYKLVDSFRRTDLGASLPVSESRLGSRRRLRGHIPRWYYSRALPWTPECYAVGPVNTRSFPAPDRWPLLSLKHQRYYSPSCICMRSQGADRTIISYLYSDKYVHTPDKWEQGRCETGRVEIPTRDQAVAILDYWRVLCC